MAFVGKIEASGTPLPVGSSLYGTCPTAASQAAKEVSLNALDALMPGITIQVKFVNSNTAQNPTLNVNALGTLPLYRYGITPPGTTQETSWNPGAVLSLTFDGSAWYIVGWENTNTTYEDVTNSNHGLMPAAYKGYVDDMRANRTLTKKFTNVEIPVSAWTADATYSSYGYKASAACAGITADWFAEVCFAPEDALNCVPAPIAETGTNTVTVWVMAQPAAAITLPTIFCTLADRS